MAIELQIDWKFYYEEYYLKGYTLRRISEIIGCAKSTVRVNFMKRNYNRRNWQKEQYGKNNPAYKEGKYCKKGRSYKRINGIKVSNSHIIYCKYHNIEKIPHGMHIHHINGNCSDDRIENLELIEAGEHCKITKPWLSNKCKV